jgi:glycosyltransferase involved in cell wall biosynthesis
MYADYDYMLICHLDAWIFKDDLRAWMAKGYDFVGAPLFLPDLGRGRFLKRMAPFGGNGGLSLRRISTCIRVLETFKPRPNPLRIAQALWFLAINRRFDLAAILTRALREVLRDWRGTCSKYNIYEDVFFTIVAKLLGARIRIPRSWEARLFSCEVNYKLLQTESLGLSSPLGIHGYDKYVDPDFLTYVQGFFDRKRKIYDLESPLDKPVVSVILIVKDLTKHGRIDSFDQALMSVVHQTYEKVEAVIVDGASTDDTLSLLRQRYGHLANVSIYSKADRSVWEAMSNGVAFSTGDLIAIMNSDDYFCTPNALALMVDRLVKTSSDWVFGSTLLISSDGNMPFPTYLPSVMNCFGIVHQSTLFKKSVIETIKPFDSGHITAENFLFVAALAAGFKAAQVQECLVHYRTGGLSTTQYSGVNYDRTVADYVRYLKKVTSIGFYLTDDEISRLYGFRGAQGQGFVTFLRTIMKIQDPRLRNLFLRACWNQIRSTGIGWLIKRKIRLLVMR